MKLRPKSLIVYFILLLLISACSMMRPSASMVETAIAQTRIAQPTNTPLPTETPTAPPTATFTPTITKTFTPIVTKTPYLSPTPYEPHWLDVVKNPINKVLKEKDEFTGYNWYRDKTSPKYRNVTNIHIIIGQYGNLYPWFIIQYRGNNWLFIESYSFLVDGVVYHIDAGYFDVERDNSGGAIWEWYEIPIKKENVEMIEAIINSKETVIRYHGQQYYDEKIVTDAEKIALKNMLALFEYLGGRLDYP